MNLGLLDASQLGQLIDALKKEGYEIIAPTVVDQAITYAPIQSTQDLPQGYTDTQEKGKYRILKTQSKRYFNYNIGARSWKQFLFPAQVKLSTTQQIPQSQVLVPFNQPKQRALLGMRSCELHGVDIQDKVLLDETYPDQHYKERRDNAIFIAVNCSKASSTCFCVSMNTGPEVTKFYDILLTEIETDTEHYFIVESNTNRGQALAKQLTLTETNQAHLDAKQESIDTVVKSISKTLDTQDIKQTLYDNHNHAHWDDVAQRCVNCANCTMACPTCFCSTTTEQATLDGTSSDKMRQWDSCFSQSFTHVHDANVRDSAKSRYRQWMTHKLASWIDQFGTSGCVGCGRCITWCPVGIDITEEYLKIKESS